MLALTHRDFVLLKEVTSNLSYHWLPDVREYDLTLFGNTEYLYSRLLQKEYSLKLSPLLFTIAKSPLAHLNENDFLIPLSMFLKNVMPESMALHFKLEHFKNMGAHSKPNESECLLVWEMTSLTSLYNKPREPLLSITGQQQMASRPNT